MFLRKETGPCARLLWRHEAGFSFILLFYFLRLGFRIALSNHGMASTVASLRASSLTQLL